MNTKKYIPTIVNQVRQWNILQFMTVVLLAAGLVFAMPGQVYAGDCNVNESCSGYWGPWSKFCCKTAMNGNCIIYQRRICSDPLGNAEYQYYDTQTFKMCALSSSEVRDTTDGICQGVEPPGGG